MIYAFLAQLLDSRVQIYKTAGRGCNTTPDHDCDISKLCCRGPLSNQTFRKDPLKGNRACECFDRLTGLLISFTLDFAIHLL
jgi:hypothetical protein